MFASVSNTHHRASPGQIIGLKVAVCHLTACLRATASRSGLLCWVVGTSGRAIEQLFPMYILHAGCQTDEKGTAETLTQNM